MTMPASIPAAHPGHHQDHRTRQVGRIRAQFALTGRLPRDPGTPGRFRIGTKGKSVRSLSVALLLAVATMTGVGVAAWAMGDTPDPAVGVLTDGASLLDGPANGPAPGSAGRGVEVGTSKVTVGQSSADRSTESAVTSDEAAIAALVPAESGSAREPASFDPPAVISTLAPGDPGFGWPDQEVSPSS